MDELIKYITSHAHQAHWYIFAAILLAGFNLPLSLDAMLIFSALLAATVVPEMTISLFLSVYLGSLFSAWIAFAIGRILGPKLFRFRLFSKLLTSARLEKIKKFNEKYGLFSLVIGRFIPFGVRNCIFMTTGLSKASFRQFVYRDAIACLIWSSICFSTCFFLGKNYDYLIRAVKTFNLLILIVLSVTLITYIWYKRRKNRPSQTRNETG